MPQKDTSRASERLTVEADAAHEGLRLDRFLAESLPALSRTRIQALIKAGQVHLRGATIEDGKIRVKPGDAYTVDVPPAEEAGVGPESIPLNIVYEDDALIVIDKPAGLVVHPGAGNPSGTLVNALIAHCGKSLSGIGGVARPGIVHRLDKDTSGLMVVAKTDAAHRALAAQFADHGRTGELERGYRALVWGAPSRAQGVVDAPIGRHPTSRVKMAVLPEGKGREAATEWRVVETYGPAQAPLAALLECHLTTGRTHQVRVHLAHIGHPVIGDPLYGQGFKSKERKLPEAVQRDLAALNRQALHAAELAFVHPVSGTLLKFNSEFAPDLGKIVTALKEL